MRSAKLGELCEIRSGGTPSRKNADFYGGAIPWAKISDIEASEGLLTTTDETITEDGLAAIRGRLFTEGTLLFAIYGSIGKMAFAGRKLSTNQAILGILNQSPTDLFDRYLFRYLEARRDDLLRDGAGIAQKNLSAAYVRNLTIPLPPLEEQKRIAEILDQADALGRFRARALDKLNTLGQAIFYEMFGDIHKNSNNWPPVQLGDLFSLKHGFAFKSENFVSSGTYVLLTPGNFFEAGGFRDRGEKQKFHNDPVPSEYILDAGDILIAMTEQAPGLLGSPLIVPESGSFLHNQRLGKVEAKTKIIPQFIFGLMNEASIRAAIQKSSTGLKVKHTSPAKIASICIGYPPLDLQLSYADAIIKLGSQAKGYLQAKALASDLFNSLQHRAFRGGL